MNTSQIKNFATQSRQILLTGVMNRILALGFDVDGNVIIDRPQKIQGGTIFMGNLREEAFYDAWTELEAKIKSDGVKEVCEEAAYTWFNRLVAILIMQKNSLIEPVMDYVNDSTHIPVIVDEARAGRLSLEMTAQERESLDSLLRDATKTSEQFNILISLYCRNNPVIFKCFGGIHQYISLLLPDNILAQGGFIDLLNSTTYLSEEDYKTSELIGWLYQYYISEKKDDVFASFKKGKKAEAEDIPAATQIFTPNWIVKYMVQNTVGRIYLDNNPYSDIKGSMQYLVESEEPTPADAIFRFDDIHDLTCADLACGSGHILNECFDLLYQLYLEEGYNSKKAIEDIFKFNLTGVDLDTRAKQLAQFALLLKACQKDSSFADAHCMPKVLDMPKPYDAESVNCSLSTACLRFIGGYENVAAQLLEQDMELLKAANNLGSIMRFNDDKEYISLLQRHYDDWTKGEIENCPEEIQALLPGVELILTLTRKFAAFVMNPPYMGSANMNSILCKYVKDNYPDEKSDLMTVFMKVATNNVFSKGMWAMINLPSWMFLGSFEKMRRSLVKEQQIFGLLQNGRGIFGSDFGSVTFVVKNIKPYTTGNYRKLYDNQDQAIVRSIETIHELYKDESCGNYIANQYNFLKIPGCPIGFWITEDFANTFRDYPRLGTEVDARVGMVSGDNNRFLRFWQEVSFSNIERNATTKNDPHNCKWYPLQKGGEFRLWYGNLNYVVNWENDGYDIINDNMMGTRIRSHNYNGEQQFKEGITWNSITMSKFQCRYSPAGFTFDASGPLCEVLNKEKLPYILGFLSSKVARYIFSILNPTVNFPPGYLESLPLINQDASFVNNIVHLNVEMSKLDWDAHETSWDFKTNELVRISNENYFDKVSDALASYVTQWEMKFEQLHENEEELNRQFIEIYGLQEELTPDVPLDEITILQAGEITHVKDSSEYGGGHYTWNYDNIMKQLISYATGCMMGRYSIDVPGLILANQGDGLNEYNQRVPNSRFEIDDDGIIPLMTSDSIFADNATLRFKNWLKVVFGEERLVENLNFIEDCLGTTLDDYFIKDFWKDHKKMYQNRPIYWLFSSKKGAFQVLVYMHRMNPYTAEKVRTKYLLPYIEHLKGKIELDESRGADLTTVERKNLAKMKVALEECYEYHDKLHDVAIKAIDFDLDDGVVVNYAKFGDVLAKIK